MLASCVAFPLALVVGLLAGELDRSVWTPPLPVADPPEGTAAPRMAQPEILYINFDGALLQSGCGNDAHYDCSTLAGLFNGYIGPYRGNTNQRISILQATRKAVADFGLRVVVDRPPADVDYTMVIYGDLGEQTFAGVAPYIDCEDLRPGDTSFTQAFSGSNTGSTVILQEAAHTWGLEHVDAEFDILNPFKSAGKHQVFLDDCFRIVSDTDLNPTPGSCNQVHTRFCESGWQNSYREMSMLFGPPIPDVTPPELTIVYPKDGSTFVAPTTFALSGEIEDELHPQIYYIEVFRDGDTLVGQTNDIGLNLNIIDPEPGEYDLLVRITDEGGNATEQRVGFTVLPEGSELPPSPDVDDEASDGCRLGAPRRPSRGWAAIGMGLLLVVGQNRKRNG